MVSKSLSLDHNHAFAPSNIVGSNTSQAPKFNLKKMLCFTTSGFYMTLSLEFIYKFLTYNAL